jgi:hypothetical protein
MAKRRSRKAVGTGITRSTTTPKNAKVSTRSIFLPNLEKIEKPSVG